MLPMTSSPRRAVRVSAVSQDIRRRSSSRDPEGPQGVPALDPAVGGGVALLVADPRLLVDLVRHAPEEGSREESRDPKDGKATSPPQDSHIQPIMRLRGDISSHRSKPDLRLVGLRDGSIAGSKPGRFEDQRCNSIVERVIITSSSPFRRIGRPRSRLAPAPPPSPGPPRPVPGSSASSAQRCRSRHPPSPGRSRSSGRGL